MAIIRAGFAHELREVNLRYRPEHMMEISPKGTVPVLQLVNGTVIEESLEIMQFVLDWQLNANEVEWIKRTDEEFKYHLDRYKYPNRYDNVNSLEHRTLASVFLDGLEQNIPSGNLSDAIFPFVRQFANHDRDWFDQQEWPNVHSWLDSNLSSEEFKKCMLKIG